MKIDIEKIKKLAKQREDENWSFRCNLKASDISSEKIDQEIATLFQKYSSEIDCTQCGNCCREITPILQEHDVQRIANALGLSISAVRNKYLSTGEDGDLTFNSRPCPFLSGNICWIYESRPDDCRSYPHLHKGEFIFKTIQAFDNCFICPIVFYVYEGLKVRFSYIAKSRY